MIGYIKGQIIAKDNRTLTVLTASGIGYTVTVPTSIAFNNEGDIELFIYSHIREDAFALFGFLDKEMQNFFEALISISGVGPKLAMDVLAEPLDKVRDAIENEDTMFLKNIKGLGKKTAERIILELKGKLPASIGMDSSKNSARISGDVFDALINLGYKRRHIDLVLEGLPEAITSPEAVIKYFLQNV